MKNFYIKLFSFFTTCLLLFNLNGFAQNQEAQIPFQGVLYEQGVPINGAKTLIFSIVEVEWEETQTVQVINGLYSTVLGSVTPLPYDLFFYRNTQNLNIEIDGTSIGDVELHKSIGGVGKEVDVSNSDSLGRNHVYIGIIKGSNVDTNNLKVGISGRAITDNGSNVGVLGRSTSPMGNTQFQYGVLGSADGEGTGARYGIRGEVFGTGTGFSTGTRGQSFVIPPAEGETSGGAFTSFDGAVGATSYGVKGDSRGPGRNIGVYGNAFNGEENWAGWFDGNVNIVGNLVQNGTDIKLTNPDGELRVGLNYTEINDAGSLYLYGANDSINVLLGSSGGGHNGAVVIYDSLGYTGAQLRVNNKGRGSLYTYNENHTNVGWFGGLGNDGFTQLVSYDDNEVFSGAALIGSWSNGRLPEFYLEGSVEANRGLGRMKVEENNGQESGVLELNRSNGGASLSARIINDSNGNDPSGFTSELMMHGDNSPNVRLGGRAWSNGDLGGLSLLGRTINGILGGYHTNADLYVTSDDTDDWGEFSLSKSNIAGETSQSMIFMSANTGTITASGNMNATAFNVTSDRRYKKNINALNNALEITNSLRGVTYNWRVDKFKNKNFTDQKQIGLIAQEVEKILPELVHTDKDGMKAVNYSQMTAVLIEAVKELSSKVTALESENSDLKKEVAEVSNLKDRIESIEKLLLGGKKEKAKSSVSASSIATK